MQEISVKIEVPQSDATDQALVVQAKALQVTDAESAVKASEFLKGIVALRKKITGVFEPLKTKAHEAHKAITLAEKEQLAPVMEAEALVKGRIGDYQAEEERKRRAEEARLRKIAEEEAAARRKQEEDARLEAAAKLEKEGKAAEAERIVAQEIARPAPAPAPVITLPTAAPKVAGVSSKSVWKFRITDPAALLAWIAADPVGRGYLVNFNETSIRQLVTAQKQAFNMPGVQAYEDKQIAVR